MQQTMLVHKRPCDLPECEMPAHYIVSLKADGFRSDIQGLRAIAVIAVILFHVNKNWLPGGFIGVDIFFVISGFLIGSIILEAKRDGRFSLLDFYLGRIRRIVPAYSALLVITSLVTAILLIPSDFGFFLDSLKYSATFFSNHYFSTFGDYFSPLAHELPLLHTWSLAVEVQFYVLFPLAIAYISQRYLKIVLPIIIIGLTAYAAYRLMILGERQTVYFSLPARVPEFLIGSTIALYRGTGREQRSHFSMLGQDPNILSFLGLGMVLASFFVITDATAFPGAAALFPTLGAALIIVSRGLVSRMLGIPVLAWLGGISYSLYLWHWPVLSLLRYFNQSYYLSSVDILVFLVITFVLSYYSWRLIETPFRKKQIYAYRYQLSFMMLFAICLMLPLSKINVALGNVLPIELTRYADGEQICHGKMFGECLRGDLSCNTEPVLVVGDSHAAQLNIFFDVVGNINSLCFRVITGSNCLTIPGFDVERIPEYSRTECISQIAQVCRYLSHTKSIVVAGMWLYHYESAAFLHALENFLAIASKKGQHVIVLAQIPMVNSNIQRVLRFNEIGLPQHIVKNINCGIANSKIKDICEKYSSVEFVDLSSNELFRNAPFENNKMIYHDGHHLNEIGAARYGAVAASLFSDI